MNTQKYLSGLIIVQAALLGFCVFYQAPCSDEFGHAYAGLRYWQDGDLQTFNVNPPLVRAIGALPLYLAPLKHQPVAAATVPYGRPEFPGGRELNSTNGKDFRMRLSMGRLLVSCFAVLGTIACYLLGKQIGDERVGLGAAGFLGFPTPGNCSRCFDHQRYSRRRHHGICGLVLYQMAKSSNVDLGVCFGSVIRTRVFVQVHCTSSLSDLLRVYLR